ncbi:MAG TPA: hypothetical protein VGM34_00285 [Chlamydiales bacterium]|jgi:hypothetical protein
MVTKTGMFVSTVARCFDEAERFDKPPIQPLSTHSLSQDTGASIEASARATQNPFKGDFAVGEADHYLPKEIRALIVEYSLNTEDWLDATGVFDASRIDPLIESNIELAAKQKLEELLASTSAKLEKATATSLKVRKEFDAVAQNAHNRAELSRDVALFHRQQSNLEEKKVYFERLIGATKRSLFNPLPSSAKELLLTHIFKTAFKMNRKQEIIEKAQAFKPLPLLKATYSRTYKIAIQIAEIASAIFHDPLFQIVVSAFIAYKAYALYAIAKVAIHHLFTQVISPSVANYVINHCSIHVVHAASLIVGTIDWVVNHQLWIFLLNIACAHLLLTRPVFYVLLFPTRLFFLPLSVVSQTFTSSIQTSDFLGRSFRNWGAVNKQTLEQIEEEKALRLWLNMAEYVASKRKKAQLLAAAAR